ncbi:MAG: VCBS repeat-containing protein, partial [Acidobacteria bacterium]|nr:VCBS repeat-containing protein [Acidobacteriota bacterium]
MNTNPRPTKLTLLLGLLALSGLTAYAYRAGEQWRSHSAAPAEQPTAILSHAHGRNAASRPSTPVTPTSAAALVPPKAEDAEPLAVPEAALEPAQSGGSYNITQAVIPGGGGVSANGNTNVNGTLGQSAAAVSSGGQYSIGSGFQTSNCPAVSLTTATLPNGTVSAAYNQTLAASGGTAPYSFSLSAGSLPNGVTLSGAGLLAGTPVQSGAFNFTISAADSQNCSGARAYTLTINCQSINVNPANLPTAQLGAFYTQSFAPVGNVGAVSFAVTGVLPAGLLFNTATGLLSGTPTQLGSFNLTVTANDAAGCSGARAYTLLVLRRNAVKADFDGDGKTDLGIFSPSTAPPLPNWSVINSGNAATVTQQWGAGYAPYFDDIVPGDYDGDGKADHAIWRGADSIWYIRKSSDGQAILQFWGANYAPYFDIPTPGDYDGDGKTDIAVFRRENGHWYIRQSGDGAVLDVPWGLSTDVPVPADYDGDGRADIVVWRGAEGNWYIR